MTTAFNATDVLYDNHPLFIGRQGSIGDRAGNFAVQNADLLLVLGCRLNIRQISYRWESFAREAYKIMVDIDPLELIKPTIKIDLPVCAHLTDFIKSMTAALLAAPLPEKSDWLHWCKERKDRYPVVLKDYWQLEKLVNPYCFMQSLSEQLPEGQIIVTGDGTASIASSQTFALKKGQRLYSNSGCASMGYDLPAAIGACVATDQQDIICIAGDGSIQQNIQELATIAFNRYPIKIFVLNNNGYHSIRQTQVNYFSEPLVGVGPESGLGFPDMEKIAFAYGISYVRCDQHATMRDNIATTLKHAGPSICEVMLTLDQAFAPKTSSKRLADGRMVTRPLEDLAPLLSKEELANNMLIEMIVEE